MKDIIITLTPIDAELFRKFQEHHEMFRLLQVKGVFDIQFGYAKLNFSSGVLQNIEKSEIVYKRT